MKKTKKWPSLLITAFAVLSFGACQDWGEDEDPPAGNQTYPTLETVATYSFDESIDTDVFQLYAYSGGDVPTWVEDEEQGGCMNLANGYARIDNPLTSVTVQNGVSLTFYAKQVTQYEEDEEGEATALDQDLSGALFSFQNTNGTQRMFMTANGWLYYDGTSGEYECYNPDDVETGMLLSQDEWHYVAVMIRDDGYSVYVDGYLKIDKDVPSSTFDFSNIVSLMNNAPYLYIGYGSDSDTSEWMIDELTIYRNQITSTQWNDPRSGKGSGSNLSEIGFFLTCEAAYLDIRAVGYCPFINRTGTISVGSSDCSTAWWSAFSDIVLLNDGETLHWNFTNYTNGSANWNNWLLVCSNGLANTEDGYSEHFVLRADAYGWGDDKYAANITSTYNWDTFTSDMNGATVELAITRSGTTISMDCDVTTTSGTTYDYTFTYDGITATDDISFFLTCEGAYLTWEPEDVVIGNVYKEGRYIVGETDCSTGWWSAFSNLSVVQETNYPFTYVFYNYTSGAANWDNWLLVCSNGLANTEDGYSEYFVLRADAYGWGDENYDGSTISSTYNWDTFASEMNGAYVVIKLVRTDDVIDMTAITTTTGGTKYEYTFSYEGLD